MPQHSEGPNKTRADKLKKALSPYRDRVVVVSGPSAGAGKSTVVRKIVALGGARVWLSLSATTRPPRADDTPGETYEFLGLAAFESLEASGGFLEANGVTEGQRYGTPVQPVIDHLRAGQFVILEIEIFGAKYIQQLIPAAFYFFLTPTTGGLDEDMIELRKRLEKRGTNDAASVERRLIQAKEEFALAEKFGFYTYVANPAGRPDEAATEMYEQMTLRSS